MQTVYRVNSTELGLNLVQSIKAMFDNQDLEITIKPLNTDIDIKQKRMAAFEKLTAEAKNNPIVIDKNIDIRALIDESHNPLAN